MFYANKYTNMSSSLTHILLIVHCRPPNHSSVEQPIGTGFSHGDFPQDEHDVSTDMYAFMQNFYKVFPHLAEYDFFVTGESYAGTCVVSFVRGGCLFISALLLEWWGGFSH